MEGGQRNIWWLKAFFGHFLIQTGPHGPPRSQMVLNGQPSVPWVVKIQNGTMISLWEIWLWISKEFVFFISVSFYHQQAWNDPALLEENFWVRFFSTHFFGMLVTISEHISAFCERVVAEFWKEEVSARSWKRRTWHQTRELLSMFIHKWTESESIC